MNSEQTGDLVARAAIHAALADVTRLRIVDYLSFTDASASEVGAALGIPSNLLAHHVGVLDNVGLVTRRPSEGDGRRNYLTLCRPEQEAGLGGGPSPRPSPQRVVFVCTANTARSHLAAALWRRASPIAASSAGTHPGKRINPGAVRAAQRHGLDMPQIGPTLLHGTVDDADFVVTVCDRAHEELASRPHAHWSIADPVPDGSSVAFDTAYTNLADRVKHLAPRLVPAAT
ncbi:MAG: ArsR family transcriptional regulator [Ornithinimicrobium sp.]